MTGDISAYLFDPRQAYSSVRLQQGRVITDLDWNENERIKADERLRLLSALVCSHGSTDDGFRLLGAQPASLDVPTGGNGLAPRPTYDVTLAPGRFLLGGHLHQWPQQRTDGTFPQTFLNQDDWLQLSGTDAGELPDVPATGRTDLVYLEAFDHPVRAVEDRELRERALGGPDTSTRLKAIRRVHVLPGVAPACLDAEAALRRLLTQPRPGDTSGLPHGFDGELRELRSKARLTVGFTGDAPTLDPCQPRTTQGYLGAENQAIRVQLRDADHFLWGYDNAEPLYRVEITDNAPGADGSIELGFITRPVDPLLFPLQGAVIEILPWGALLANLEKVAAAEGHLARVSASYDPGTGTLRIIPAIPVQMQEWLDSSERDPILDPHGPDDPARYFYARFWQPAPEGATGLSYAFAPGTAVPLPGTGLSVTFSDFGIQGDFWIIAARPNTPDLVVPWRLLEQAAPFGPRRFYAPLGLVHWTLAGQEPTATVEDCRHRFSKLCEVECCCTVQVGDGNSSHGQLDDLQAAIDLIPPAGGRICLLPGRHVAAARLAARTNITIEGCGPRSRVVSDAGQSAPVFEIEAGADITLRDFAIEAEGTIAVQAVRTDRLTLERLDIGVAGRAAVIASAIDGFDLLDCSIAQLEQQQTGAAPTQEPAVFAAGRALQILRNRIAAPAVRRARLSATGGLQIGGDSVDVLIEDNLIEGGMGAGIVLGSVDFQPHPTIVDIDRLRAHYLSRVAHPGFANLVVISDDDCLTLDPHPVPPPDPNDPSPPEPVSDGPVEDCRIIDNRIIGMGGSGITAAYWFIPDREPDGIVTNRLLIAENLIDRCMRLPVGIIPPELLEIAGFGGIALAIGAEIAIRDNRITNVGTERPAPIVGIYVLDGVAVAIQRNHLRDNGRVADLENAIPAGRVGAIVLGLVRPGTDLVTPVNQVVARQDGAPALIVEDNVAAAREGRALLAIGVGPMVIHGNQFTAHGTNSLRRIPIPGVAANTVGFSGLASNGLAARTTTRNPLTAFLDFLGGAAVTVLNLGVSNELYLQLLGYSGLGLIDAEQPGQTGGADDLKLLANGNVQFNDNQVVFDTLAPTVTLTLSAVLLLSLDDIAMQDNQLDCDKLFDIVAVDALVLGFSVRLQGNRLKESLGTTFLSALSIGLFNDTSHNQSTHCIFHVGLREPRIVLSGAPGASAQLDTNRHLVSDKACAAFERQRDPVAGAIGGPPPSAFVQG